MVSSVVDLLVLRGGDAPLHGYHSKWNRPKPLHHRIMVVLTFSKLVVSKRLFLEVVSQWLSGFLMESKAYATISGRLKKNFSMEDLVFNHVAFARSHSASSTFRWM